jgi:hypothetical protein
MLWLVLLLELALVKELVMAWVALMLVLEQCMSCTVLHKMRWWDLEQSHRHWLCPGTIQ